jgi:hypothetical protein
MESYILSKVSSWLWRMYETNNNMLESYKEYFERSEKSKYNEKVIVLLGRKS